MKKETEKRTYESPQLTVVVFKTERGFATSGYATCGVLGLGMEHQEEGFQDLEDRGQATTWSW